MTEQVLNYYIYLLAYAFIGWCSECIYCSIYQKRFINRGFLNGPICPIYGFGALLILLILMPFSLNPLVIFALGVLITSALEYFTSFILEKMFHAKWWDYSTYPFNINGRVCLKNSLLFGIMCIFGVYIIQPFLMNFVDKISFNAKGIFLVGATLIIAVDMFVTIHAMLKLNGKLAQIAAIKAELEEVLVKEGVHGLADAMEERISESVHGLADTLEERLKEKLSEKAPVWQRRLVHAFPGLKFAQNNEHFQTLKNALEDKRAKLKNLKNR